MKKTKIDWCDSTWNPVTGCFHNCKYCYAKSIANRFGKKVPDYSGYDKKNIGIHCLDSPVKGNVYPYLFEPTFLLYKLDEPQKTKKHKNIFVCSMADLFGNWVPDEWIQEVFDACAKAPQHRYLFLTKNPKRYIELANKNILPSSDNMWYGTTITSPTERFFWSDKHKTFVSIEPILEDFSNATNGLRKKDVDWVIVGAETGNQKAKTVPKKEWIDAIVGVCDELSIPIFLKSSLSSVMGTDNIIQKMP